MIAAPRVYQSLRSESVNPCLPMTYNHNGCTELPDFLNGNLRDGQPPWPTWDDHPHWDDHPPPSGKRSNLQPGCGNEPSHDRDQYLEFRWPQTLKAPDAPARIPVHKKSSQSQKIQGTVPSMSFILAPSSSTPRGNHTWEIHEIHDGRWVSTIEEMMGIFQP